MTIKPQNFDSLLKYIDEDNRKFFRSRISRVDIDTQVFSYVDNELRSPYPVSDTHRVCSSYLELLTFLPECIQTFVDNSTSADFRTVIFITVYPLMGKSLHIVHDPYDTLNKSALLRAHLEHDSLLKQFNEYETKQNSTSGVAEEQR